MRTRRRFGIALLGAAFFGVTMGDPNPSVSARTSSEDGSLCLTTAERADAGELLTADEKEEAHQACRRALRATGSVLQKYQFEEADFAITGTRHKY